MKNVFLKRIFFVLYLVITFSICTFAQNNSIANVKSNKTNSSLNLSTSENKQSEEKRLELEREKFNFEKENEEKKLQIENSKAYWTPWATAAPLITAVVALIIGIITIGIGIKNQREQSALQMKLKAAEIVFSGISPKAIHTRAKALHEFFGDEQSAEFAENFQPEKYDMNKESPEAKMFFCELILKYPDKEIEIIKMWHHLFPPDYKWLRRYNPDYFKGIWLPDQEEPSNKESGDKVNEPIKPVLQEKKEKTEVKKKSTDKGNK